MDVKYTSLKTLIIAKLALMMLIVSCSVLAKPDHSRWAKHNPQETQAVQHQDMSSILQFLTVTERGKSSFDYALLTGPALEYVKDYKAFLESIPVSLLNKDEQLAYWLNLHNVTVIEKLGSSKSRSLRRIKDKRGEPGDPGDWWSEKLVKVEGIPLSLEEIEQDILLSHWQEPKVVYGLFYGVKGDGFSGQQAFAGKTVKTQLADLAKTFINDKNNVKVSRNKVQVSSLLAWNKDSLFAGDDQKLLAHLRTYATGDVAKRLVEANEIHKKHKFSWTSNAYKRPRQSNSFSGDFGGGGGFGGGGS
jgi:hypothetical protein